MSTGDQTSPDTIVLIHGLWMTPRCWEHWFARYQSRGYTVLAPAYPGLEIGVEMLRADPSPIAAITIPETVAHLERIIHELDNSPIIMGHSFGGAFVQILLDHGFGAAGVAINSVPTEGVLNLPLSQMKATFPELDTPANRHRPVGFTPKQFHDAFTNTLSEGESQQVYDRYHIPAPGAWFWDRVPANFTPGHQETWVDYANDDRAPLLFIAGGADHIAPPAVNRSNAKHYDKSSALTNYHEFPGRTHYTLGQPGWEKVADYALRWALEHATTGCATTSGQVWAARWNGSLSLGPQGKEGHAPTPEHCITSIADQHKEATLMTVTTTKPILEPEAQAFADATAHPPYLFDLGPIEGRKTVDQVQSGEIAKPEVAIEDTTVPGGPNGDVSVRIIRPPSAIGVLPIVLYTHGAGWVFGDTLTHDRLIRELAVGTGAAVVFPNYSLSPEAKYPTALEECYAVAGWLAEHGRDKLLDGSRLAVAGDSVGGNMTAALTLLAKQRGMPSIGAQVLFYPVTDANFDTESYHQFATGYFLSREGMQWFWDQYTTDPAQRNEVTASPLRASLDQLVGLPPALVITGEADVLRDEGEAYAAKLRQAGVSVTAVRYGGIIHDFVMLNALRSTHAAQAAITQATEYLRASL
jgi:acetyl esterase